MEFLKTVAYYNGGLNLTAEEDDIVNKFIKFEKDSGIDILQDFLADPSLFLLGDDVSHPHYM